MTTAATISARLTLNKKDFDKGVADAKKGGKDLKQNLEGVVKGAKTAAGAIGVAGVALKQMYDVARRGAELITLDTRFDRLAMTIGSTGDTLKTKLLDTMGGLVSESEAVGAAVDFMSLGLAKNEEQVIRLANASAQLGFDMNQLVLTLTNMTTMRFDALGVAVDGFDDKLEALKATGMDTNDAFTEAFLQQAEAQIEKVGSVADTVEGKFLRAEATIKNFWDSLSKNAAIAVGNALTAFEQLNTILGGFDDQLDSARSRIMETSDSYGEYTDRIIAATGAAEGWTQAAIEHNQAAARTGTLLPGMIKGWGLLTEEQWENSQIMKFYADTALPDVTDSMAEMTDQTNAAAGATTNLSSTLQDVIDLSNQQVGDQFLQMAQGIEFANAGGAELNELMAFVEDNAGNIDAAYSDAFVNMGENAFAFAEVIQGSLDGLTTNQIAQNIASGLDIPLEQALNLISMIESGLLTIDGMMAEAEIIVTLSGSGGGALTSLTGGVGTPAFNPNVTATGFATGGSFTVGGSGGTDSQFVGFMASPGENVSITPPQKGDGVDTGGVTNNFWGPVSVMDGSEVADTMGLRTA
jgi:hypothetical protein